MMSSSRGCRCRHFKLLQLVKRFEGILKMRFIATVTPPGLGQLLMALKLAMYEI